MENFARDRDIELLELIKDRLNCLYISDMRNPLCRESIIGVISNIERKRFPLEQWEEAANYIVGNNEKFKNEEEVRKYIKSFCRK